ncbi:MAG: DNA-formamidopyrimidine glycosylase [bacterium]|nr:DNA-formamidopyrimidine glycosylase [bacterium]
MPELPEVETIRRGLDETVIGLELSKVTVLLQKSFVGDYRTILATSITSTKRRGKLLILNTSGPCSILIHLRMTGQLIFSPTGDHSRFPDKSTKVIIDFSTGETLYFNDYRTFGYIHVLETSRILEHSFLEKIGIEPFDVNFNSNYFAQLVSRCPGMNVKSFLLDQTKIAGLGNIYADESLFLAGVLPTRSLKSLSAKELNKLHISIVNILTKGIQLGGSSRTSYVTVTGEKGMFLLEANVYGRAKLACRVCMTPIQKIKHAGRGTHFCHVCQT